MLSQVAATQRLRTTTSPGILLHTLLKPVTQAGSSIQEHLRVDLTAIDPAIVVTSTPSFRAQKQLEKIIRGMQGNQSSSMVSGNGRATAIEQGLFIYDIIPETSTAERLSPSSSPRDMWLTSPCQEAMSFFEAPTFDLPPQLARRSFNDGTILQDDFSDFTASTISPQDKATYSLDTASISRQHHHRPFAIPLFMRSPPPAHVPIPAFLERPAADM